jgi:hypothetical protein
VQFGNFSLKKPASDSTQSAPAHVQGPKLRFFAKFSPKNRRFSTPNIASLGTYARNNYHKIGYTIFDK